MALPIGSRVGPYAIVAAIGEGGMGQVYRATDTRLGRDVALKILPEAFARDPERVARFEREAKSLASVNHPNIAQVYGFEHNALAMELLDGETLRDRLIDGALSVRKAVEIASQLARGLAAAHDRGIVHRDLKPENVFVLQDGHVKILDFGLAATRVASSSGASETVAAITDPGTIMGTVGYMAPEQVRGQTVDHRADLFALGLVLHEMLTGRRVFSRETAAETLTSILRDDPADPGATRSDVGPALDRIVRHSLEKNPIERFQTARDLAFALDALSGSASQPVPAVAAGAPQSAPSRWWMGVAAVATAMAGGFAFLAFRPTPQPPPGVPYVASLPLPDGIRFSSAYSPALRQAISPDGRHLAFVGFSNTPSDRGRLFLQSLDGQLARPVAGVENASAPFWTPDSRTLAFSTGEGVKRMDIAGGTPAIIPGASGLGTFLDDQRLLMFSRGGKIQELRPPDTQPRDVFVSTKAGVEFAFPVALPGGRRILVSFRNVSAPSEEGIYIANLDGSDKRLLVPNREAINIAYANGALLYLRNQSIVAQRFDLETERLSGDPTVLAEDVVISGGGFANAAFSVSQNGTLVYQPSSVQSFSRLQWMSRTGAVIGPLGDEADYSNLELSPDGRQLAVSVTDPAVRSRDIWLVDVVRGVRQRLTFDTSEERAAVWTRDGRRLIYNSKRLNLYARAANGSGAESSFLTDDRSKDPRQVSPDGRHLLYRRTGDTTGNDIWMMPIDGSGAPTAIVETPFDENYASFSPDGRSIVYVSDESGDAEVYVLSLDGSGGKVRVSTAGGTFPRWRRDGSEIVYLDPSQQIMSVPVSGSGSSFRAEAARALFRVGVQPGPGVPFDVTADGQRFIVNTTLPSRAAPAFTIIVNWPALMPPQ